MHLLRYNVAMSLDGFIAGPKGEYDWIPADPGVDFEALFAEFSHVILGRKTFEAWRALGDQAPTFGYPVLVVSTTLPPPGLPGVEVAREVVPERIRALKAETSRDVWLFGGGTLFRSLLDAGLVDRVEVSVVPVLLGGGIPLLPPGRRQALRLLESRALPSGIAQLAYAVDGP